MNTQTIAHSLHVMLPTGNSLYVAQYDNVGGIISARQYSGRWNVGQGRPVKVNGPSWRALARYGVRYVSDREAFIRERMVIAAVAVRSTNA